MSDNDWFINFSASGIKALDKEALAGIQNALLQAKTYETYSIYTNVKDGQVLDIGVISRLKDIGESVGMFDPTVIPSSFNNQEGKRIYDIVPPSDISRRLNLLKDTVNVSILKDYIKTKDADTFKKLVLNNDINNTYYFYGFFTSEKQVDNFLRYTYKHGRGDAIEYKFLWHGLMGFTPNGVRLVGPEPLNPVLLYNRVLSVL